MAGQLAPKSPALMTVDEFLDWPGDGTDTRYELVEGVLRAMAPTSVAHGIIHGRISAAISNHLDVMRPGCQLVVAPGVQPHLRAKWNHRIPELGVTCTPNTAGEKMLPEPVLLIEILSPSNSDETWSNVPLYATLPSVMEILIVHSTKVEAELLRRDKGGRWPKNGEAIAADGVIRLESIGLELPLRAVYRGTHLA
jgi:Uma2 family endonuclease